MAKKDTDTRLDIERSGEQPCDGAEQQQTPAKEEQQLHKTEVKNAHAVGLGAIGRHDEDANADNSNNNAY